MFEHLGLGAMTPQTASLVLGALIGFSFGAIAEVSKFCLRRGLVAPRAERGAALAQWLLALSVAIAGTQALVAASLLDFGDHRFHAPDMPFAALVLGGAMFGAGMVLARGCAARLTVLSATGNLRAGLVMIVFSLVALATMRGVLAPARIALGDATLPIGGSMPPGVAVALCGGLLAGATALARRSAITAQGLLAGAAIGALVPIAWIGTGFVLQDPFDPIPMQAIAFTGPHADTVFWFSTLQPVLPGFGVGLVIGAVAGAGVSALRGGRFRWQGFSGPRQTGRYMLGATLMGFGGVLAGGCSIGAGLSGTSTLSFSALTALACIIAGAIATDRLLSAWPSGSAGQAARPPARQAV